MKKVCWISAGVSSFVAGYLERETVNEYLYIDVADQHEDSMRFIKDCEKALGKEINILKNTQYKDVDDVIRSTGFICNIATGYTPCTNILKKRIRKEWEMEQEDNDICYVWGFDCAEKHRAERLLDSMPEVSHSFPLIDRMLSKEDAHGICDMLGIRRPLMYDLGYRNNNCIGCIKGGMGYWNRIRRDFPEVFESRMKLEQDLGITILKGMYLKDLDPNRGRLEEDVPMECSIMCQLNI